MYNAIRIKLFEKSYVFNRFKIVPMSVFDIENNCKAKSLEKNMARVI